MNERIKELANKSDIKFDADLSHLGIDTAVITPTDLEKFAQLIVQECAGIYDKIDNGNLHMGTYDYLEALQKTFGVEE